MKKTKKPAKINSFSRWLKQMVRCFFNRVSVNFYSDWNSFIFWKPMNWRDFTFIFLKVETNAYSTILEIQFSFLGLNFRLNIWRDTAEERKKETDEFFKGI